MKTLFNLTTDSYDLLHYKNSAELTSDLAGFDGLELMCFDPDSRGIICPEQVIGIHMSFFAYWLDFWMGDEEALINEFDNLENCKRHYGGSGRSALLTRFQKDLDNAMRYKAEYVVFHVSDCSTQEVFSRRYNHSNEEVIAATCQLLNQVFKDLKDGPALLLENLWYPGFDFTRPDMTKMLLDGIEYKNKGIMLDTGHLLHTNPKIRNQEEGLQYINQMLDLHGDLVKNIRGVHLNQSTTGQYALQIQENLPIFEKTFSKREWQLLRYVQQIDKHRPFTCQGVKELVKRISPDYLTFEFISQSREERLEYLQQQKDALYIINE